MTLEPAEPKGKRLRWQMVKGNVGPCWRSLIQSELSRGSHKSPNRVRNAKSGNITPVSRKLGRQEWNKTPGIRPSLPPFTKYIDALIDKQYCDIPTSKHVPTRNNISMFQQGTTSSSPATNNAIRGAEQSGNIANQRFARTWMVRG